MNLIAVRSQAARYAAFGLDDSASAAARPAALSRLERVGGPTAALLLLLLAALNERHSSADSTAPVSGPPQNTATCWTTLCCWYTRFHAKLRGGRVVWVTCACCCGRPRPRT
ncbi:hypothetical protein FOA52_003568 [Chlamydomonas sp. UWO 241]|nr:hypothetical protein FOA52_003568 [Chlamydomonas sp. UWO 241]